MKLFLFAVYFVDFVEYANAETPMSGSANQPMQ